MKEEDKEKLLLTTQEIQEKFGNNVDLLLCRQVAQAQLDKGSLEYKEYMAHLAQLIHFWKTKLDIESFLLDPTTRVLVNHTIKYLEDLREKDGGVKRMDADIADLIYKANRLGAQGFQVINIIEAETAAEEPYSLLLCVPCLRNASDRAWYEE